MAKTAHRAIDRVERAQVSQHTHQISKPPSGEVQTRRQELDAAIIRKQELDHELAYFSKAAFAKAEGEVRRRHRDNEQRSFSAWMQRKSEMEADRQRLVAEKLECERAILRLKPLAEAERLRDHAELKASEKDEQQRPGRLEDYALFREDGSLDRIGVFAHMLVELRAIRKLLEPD